jgi:arylsulfatase A
MKFLLILLLFILSSTAEKKPNIIFIFADDIGYEALNCYGGLDFKTPNLDKMAAEGRRFQSMYTSPVCTPSRVSMHTGLYTFRHNHMTVLPVHKGTTQIVDFQQMPTFAQQLQKHGYKTSVTGKWQMATLEVWPEHIKDSGFDSWCVWQIWSKGKKMPRHWNPCLNKDGQIMEGIKDKFGPDVLADYVINQMESANKNGKPFFILHNELLPHWPVVDTPDDRRYGRKPALSGMIGYMDKLVGRILNKVDELGIRDNTYVFFMGDNGTWEKDFNNPKRGQKGEKKHTRHTIKGPVNGGKAIHCDAGSHVPFIAWGPSQIPKNTSCAELIDVVDLFKTFCDLAGAKIPEAIKTDGRSFAPQIHGKSGPKREWTHQGWNNEENIFDGKYRYFINTGKLWDATNLPYEAVADNNKKTKAVIEKCKLIYKKIKNNEPTGPEAVLNK